MSTFSTSSTDEAPEPEAAPEVEAPPAPATDEEKVHDLVGRLQLEPTASTLDAIWSWATHHFGLVRP